MATQRNPQDLTLRNLRALKARIRRLEQRVRALAQRLPRRGQR